MSDADESICTPPDLREVADKVGASLVPEKSKVRYEKAYEVYTKWCQDKGVKNFGSENVVLAYFSNLSKDKRPSTLWSNYSMLKTMLNIKINVNISKFVKLRAFLKKENVGYRAKKSNVFTKAEIDKFINEAPLQLFPQKVNNFILNWYT